MQDDRLIDAKRCLSEAGYVFKKIVRLPEAVRSQIRDAHMYAPYITDWEMFLPYIGDADIDELFRLMNLAGAITLVTPDRLGVLKSLFLQTTSLPGEVWETGCYRGGTALFLRLLDSKYSLQTSMLRLFDTFEGMPDTNPVHDFHKAGDFQDTSLESVQDLVGKAPNIDYRKGIIPTTFNGLEDRELRFVHVDLDIYQAILDTCTFIYPRMVKGGCVVFDDYGFFSCPGARLAVDNFFSDKRESVLVLPTGQAIVVKL